MNKQYLMDEAAQLLAPSTEAANEYTKKQERLVAELNQLFSERSDLEQLIGNGNQAMMEDNHRNHGRFMASFLSSFNPEVLVETVLWVFSAYRNHGFQLTYWPAQLDFWLLLMKRELSPKAYQEIEPVYRFMLFHQPTFAALTNPNTPDHIS